MKKIILATLIVLLVIVNFATSYSPRTPKTLVCCDEIEYYTIAKNIAGGNGYSLNAQKPFNPTLLREPGYPLFLALILKTGDKLIFAQIFNILLSLGTALLLFQLSKNILPIRLAAVPPIIFLLSPRVAYYSWTILSDTLATFLLTACIIALYAALRTNRPPYLFATGLLFGMLVLTKMSFLLLIPMLLGIFLICKFSTHCTFKNIRLFNDMRATFSSLLIITFSFLLILTPWFARNMLQLGTFTPTVRTGQLIFERTRHFQYLTLNFQGFAEIPNDILAGWSTAFAQSKKLPPIESPSTVVYGAETAPGHFFILNTRFSEREADKIMVRESVKLIKTYPYLYILQLPFEFLKFNYLEFIPGIFKIIQKNTLPVIQLALLAGLILIASILSFGLLLRGIVALYRNAGLLELLILLFLFYTNIIHELLYVTPRYSFVVYPLVVLIMVYGLQNLEIKNALPSHFFARRD